MSASRSIMRAEIEAQPRVLRNAIPILRQEARFMGAIRRQRRLVLCGCGDSLTAPGIAAEALGVYKGSALVDSAEVAARYLRLGRDDIVIATSVSGTTAATLAAVEAARTAGAKTCGVTVSPDSPLARAADHLLRLPYRPLSRATPHTLDFFVTVAALVALTEASGAGASGLDELSDVVEATLTSARPGAAATARSWSPASTLYVLGSGPGLASARYIVAKFHEAFGCRAIAAETEDVAHGQHLAFRAGDLALLLALDPPSRARTARLVPNLARLGVVPVVVGEAAAETGVHLPRCMGWLAQAAACVAGQLLCLAAAEANDLPVVWPDDHPNLEAQRALAAPLDQPSLTNSPFTAELRSER